MFCNNRVLCRLEHGERGFTLVEVLVAFVIAALALGVVVHATTAAVLSTRIAGRVDQAVARAQSHMAEASAGPLREGDHQDDESDGFHWRIHIAAAETAHPAAELAGIPRGTVTLYHVTVIVTWTEAGHDRSVRLDSAQLGPVE